MNDQDDDPAAGAWTRRSLLKASLAGGALAAAVSPARADRLLPGPAPAPAAVRARRGDDRRSPRGPGVGPGDGAVDHRDVPRPHRGAEHAGAGAAGGDRDQPGGAGDRRRARRRAARQGSARASPRHPDPAQGQHRHRRPHDHHRRLARPRRLDPGPRRLRRRAAARGRRGPARQGEPLRVGQLPLLPLHQRLEQPRRPVPEPLRARPQPLGLQLGLGRRGRGQPLRRRRGLGDRRLDRLPVVDLRHRRHQADGRPAQPGGSDPDLPHAGHGRSHGPHRRRRRHSPGRHDRRRRARRGHAPEPRQGALRLYEVPRSQGPRRRADRRLPPALARQEPLDDADPRRGAGGDEGGGRDDRRSGQAAFRGQVRRHASTRSCSTISRRTSTATSPSSAPRRPSTLSRRRSTSTSAIATA